MSDIEVSQATAKPAQTTLISPPEAAGWMCWYRTQTTTYWSNAYDHRFNESRDYLRCPYPLFETRELALEAGRRCLGSSGGELKTVHIQL
jgi:hypothetical protein